MEGRVESGLVLELIARGALAGHLRITAREKPDAAKGLLRAARFQAERCTALMEEILAGAREGWPSAGRIPLSR